MKKIIHNNEALKIPRIYALKLSFPPLSTTFYVDKSVEKSSGKLSRWKKLKSKHLK